MDRFEKISKGASLVSFWVACGASVGLLLLTSFDLIADHLSDLVGRNVFNWTWAGGYEITGLLGLLIVGFAIPYTQIIRGHVAVDFFARRMPPRARNIISIFTTSLVLAIFALIIRQMLLYGRIIQDAGETTAMEAIPLAPFAYAMAFAALLMCLVLVMTLIKSVKGDIGK